MAISTARSDNIFPFDCATTHLCDNVQNSYHLAGLTYFPTIHSDAWERTSVVFAANRCSRMRRNFEPHSRSAERGDRRVCDFARIATTVTGMAGLFVVVCAKGQSHGGMRL